jgi:hypothetical protein
MIYCFLNFVVGRKILLYIMGDYGFENVQYNPA